MGGERGLDFMLAKLSGTGASGSALLKRISETLKAGARLLKEAKGLGG